MAPTSLRKNGRSTLLSKGRRTHLHAHLAHRQMQAAAEPIVARQARHLVARAHALPRRPHQCRRMVTATRRRSSWTRAERRRTPPDEEKHPFERGIDLSTRSVRMSYEDEVVGTLPEVLDVARWV